MISRRSLFGAFALLAAPSIVRASSIMLVRPMPTLTMQEAFLDLFEREVIALYLGRSTDLITRPWAPRNIMGGCD